MFKSIQKQFSQNEILALAIPASIENLLQASVGFVDSLMIAQISLLAVSAVGVVNGIMAIFQAVFIALGIAATSLIARNIGAKNHKAAKQATSSAILLAATLGILLALSVVFWGKNFLSLAGARGELLTPSYQFLLLVGISCIFWSLLTVEGAILRATGDTKTPMFISLWVNLFNISFNFLLIFVFHFGIIGAGMGTILARLLGATLLFQKIQKTPLKISSEHFTNSHILKKLTSLSIPSMIERFMMRFGDVFINIFILQLGTLAFASFTIIENIASFTYMPILGIATAAATLIGKSIGENQFQKAKEILLKCNKIGLFTMCMIALLFLFLGGELAQLFTTNETALKEIRQTFPVMLTCLPLLAYSIIDASALQVSGDTKTPMIATTFGMLGVRVFLVWLLALKCSFGLSGVFIAITLDNLWRALFLHWKLNKFFHKKTD